MLTKTIFFKSNENVFLTETNCIRNLRKSTAGIE